MGRWVQGRLHEGTACSRNAARSPAYADGTPTPAAPRATDCGAAAASSPSRPTNAPSLTRIVCRRAALPLLLHPAKLPRPALLVRLRHPRKLVAAAEGGEEGGIRKGWRQLLVDLPHLCTHRLLHGRREDEGGEWEEGCDESS